MKKKLICKECILLETPCVLPDLLLYLYYYLDKSGSETLFIF